MKQFREKLNSILWALRWLFPMLTYFIQDDQSDTAVYDTQSIGDNHYASTGGGNDRAGRRGQESAEDHHIPQL